MGMTHGADSMGRFGFSSIQDWFASVVLSFPAPWSLRPRTGKYYGTEIQDARGVCVLTVWRMAGGPSVREKARFGAWSPEAWNEYCSDSHWESEGGLAIAEAIVALRNAAEGDDWGDTTSLTALVLAHGSWDEESKDDIACGGPLRRRLTPPSRP